MESLFPELHQHGLRMLILTAFSALALHDVIAALYEICTPGLQLLEDPHHLFRLQLL